ncbi:MAG TPA: SDR family NAD(P)-dependent oxidoreductase [Steroidobacteraceae bacterium]|nr:SDR family NAD(P)-dependent oxidoreductase [Steroidobacteraceae bacterium]
MNIPLKVLITGASEGIGLEVARRYAASGAELLLVARRPEILAHVAHDLGGGIETEALDLTDSVALEVFLNRLDAQGYTPDLLINSAGQGLSGDFLGTPWNRLESMLTLNMRAVARLAHWAGGKMRTAGRGAIVNLSAAVATRPVPHFAAYAASKAFVSNLSIALDYELRGSGVRVCAIHPPAVRTRFADAANADLQSTWVLKLFPSVSAETVANAVIKAATHGHRSLIVGPVAALVMGTAPIMPRVLDLPFMSLLFKGRQSIGAPRSITD